MKTNFKFNANHYVKAKLNEKGEKVLRDLHDGLSAQMQEHGGKGLGPFELKTDEDGYYQAQLWHFMQDFGPYMGVTESNLFDLNLIFVEGEVTEGLPSSFEHQPLLDVVDQLTKAKQRLHSMKKEVARLIIEGKFETAKSEIGNLENLEKSVRVYENSKVTLDWSGK